MINKNFKKENGYILLLSIIFLSVISLSVSIFILNTGLSNSQNAFLIEKSFRALSLAEACVESALNEIKNSVPFTGSQTLNFGADECSFTVVNNGGQNRTIEAEGIVDSVIKKIIVQIDAINPQINVASWQEVADF